MMHQTQAFCWTPDDTPPELAAMLRCLAEEYPLEETAAGQATVRFVHEPGRNGYAVERADNVAVVRYGRLSHAGRALGSLLAGLDGDSGDAPAFSTLGVLLDCAHNATITPGHLRKWLRRLALLGFNTAMIYTEAGYRLPDEPHFGYMRGSYTLEEMRELDRYAASLGIELIGSIQALGHLEQVLKWSSYAAVRDTEHTLLVGDPATAQLVDKMIAFWAEALQSRRLHVGMDETYDLGRGRYLDMHGYRRGLDIYLEHLQMVTQACTRHGVRPMVWSDVLFRLAGGKDSYYDRNSRVPDEVRDALPPDIDLVYWDYYNDDPAHYRDRIEAHRALGHEPVMASGVWTWPTPWHDWKRTEEFGGACVAACREIGLQEMIFTMWSDDGAFWDVDSALAGVALMAEQCHGDGNADWETLARRFYAVCGSDLAAHRTAARINDSLQACAVLWDDPLLTIYLRYAAREGTNVLREAAANYSEIAEALAAHVNDTAAGDLGHAALTARVMAAKVGLAARLLDAYAADDRTTLGELVEEASNMAVQMEELGESFRRRWLACCRPLGLEVLQIRFAGQVARYRELARRLEEYLAEKVATIEELDEASRGACLPARGNTYRGLASGARVF